MREVGDRAVRGERVAGEKARGPGWATTRADGRIEVGEVDVRELKTADDAFAEALERRQSSVNEESRRRAR